MKVGPRRLLTQRGSGRCRPLGIEKSGLRATRYRPPNIFSNDINGFDVAAGAGCLLGFVTRGV